MIIAAKVLGFTLGLALRASFFVAGVYLSLQVINWLGA
jgi:hypothetical protein